VIAASLNLAPSIARSFTEVSEAQRLRGWRPGGPSTWAEIVVPVVLTSAEGSIQLAESMEARGFGSGPRTSYGHAALRLADWIVIASAACALAGFIVARALGWAADWYAYPALGPPAIDPRPLACCLLLLTPALLWPRRT
jgi:energy-coupling factor transport system permease protein